MRRRVEGILNRFSFDLGDERGDFELRRAVSVRLRDARDILLGRVPFARKGLLLALAAAVLNQACASTSILIYAQHMLQTVGVGGQVGLSGRKVRL